MKKLIALLLITICATGCGRIRTEPLPYLFCPKQDSVTGSAEVLTHEQAEKFLGSSLKRSRAKAVHVTLKNNSDIHYHFSKRDLSIPLVPIESIIEDESASVIGRSVLGWLIGGSIWCVADIICCGEIRPMPIANVIGATAMGVTASNRNDSIQKNFTQADHVGGMLRAGGSLNFVLFVPEAIKDSSLEVVLYEQPMGDRHVINIDF